MMDLTSMNRPVGSEVGDPLWTAGTGSPTAAAPDSFAAFADHLQGGPPADPAAHASEAPPPPAAHAAPDDRLRQGDNDDADDDVPERRETTGPAADATVHGGPVPSGETADLSDSPQAPQRSEDAAESADARAVPAESAARATASHGGQSDAVVATAPALPEPAVERPTTIRTGLRSPSDATASGPAASASNQAIASPPSPDDPAVFVMPAAPPKRAAEGGASESATAAAADKNPGKPRPERTSTPTRPAGGSATSSAPGPTAIARPDSAAAEASASRVNQALTAAIGEPSQASPDAENTPATQGRDGEARGLRHERISSLTERFSEQMPARGGSTSHATGEVTHVDQLRLIQRVARALEAAPQRGGLLRLRLRPPELGALRLDVSLRDGNLSARIEAETHTARTVLLEHLPQLRERLAEHGLRIEQFEVDVAGHQGQPSADMPGSSHDAQDAWATGPARPRADTSTELIAEPASVSRTLQPLQPGRLNVVI